MVDYSAMPTNMYKAKQMPNYDLIAPRLEYNVCPRPPKDYSETFTTALNVRDKEWEQFRLSSVGSQIISSGDKTPKEKRINNSCWLTHVGITCESHRLG